MLLIEFKFLPKLPPPCRKEFQKLFVKLMERATPAEAVPRFYCENPRLLDLIFINYDNLALCLPQDGHDRLIRQCNVGLLTLRHDLTKNRD
jgi:hypothetical protein